MIKNNQKLLVVTRKDLSEGQQAVQSCHAAIAFCMENPTLAKEWHTISRYLCLVSVENEEELQKLILKCTQWGFLFSAIKEPDLEDQLTAIAIEPSDGARKLISNYSLTLKPKQDGTNQSL